MLKPYIRCHDNGINSPIISWGLSTITGIWSMPHPRHQSYYTIYVRNLAPDANRAFRLFIKICRNSRKGQFFMYSAKSQHRAHEYGMPALRHTYITNLCSLSSRGIFLSCYSQFSPTNFSQCWNSSS